MELGVRVALDESPSSNKMPTSIGSDEDEVPSANGPIRTKSAGVCGSFEILQR